jgi:hypothetical protein
LNGGNVTGRSGSNLWQIFGWIIVLVVVGFTVAGLWAMTAVLPANTAPGETEMTPGPSDRWNVSVLGPRSGASIEHCLEDPLIEESVQTANLPSTHLGIKLLETAAQEDAERIADCLRESLGNGEVSITSPKR